MKEKILIVEDEFIVASDLANMLIAAGYQVCATADTVDSAKEAVDRYQPDWVLLDIFLQDDSMGTSLAPYLHEKGIGFIYISANTNQSVLEMAKATQPYGFLVKPFREKDLMLMLDIALGKHESIKAISKQHQELLQQGLNLLTEENTPYDRKVEKAPSVFQSLIPFDMMTYDFLSQDGYSAMSGVWVRIGYNEYQISAIGESAAENKHRLTGLFHNYSGKGTTTAVFAGKTVSVLSDQELNNVNPSLKHEIRTVLQFVSTGSNGSLQIKFFNKKEDVYDHGHKELLLTAEKFIFRLFRQLSHAPSTTVHSNLRKAARTESFKPIAKFDGIVGQSAALLNLLDNVQLVAATDVSVLLLGESGTGKEKIAQNIHQLSSRRAKPYITVNCAAIPAELVESELFGHEAGAFTGATDRRIGKFESANGGSIFLDEIGELPLESQVKLLRVLQEKQLERIGSSKTINVDVRIITATNRNLEQEVGEGRFRLDLFYRLNVFPITLPPLKERGEDILILAKYFLDKSATALGRSLVPELSVAASKQLMEHNWPGNIRELEHLMERTLIKTKEPFIGTFELTLSASGQFAPSTVKDSNKTLQQMETEHILSVLKNCGGKINGPGGAAEILGLPASTLNSKMKKLGIKKTSSYDC